MTQVQTFGTPQGKSQETWTMIIGHIGARAGSKGVPNKNFRMMHGKHLIDWSLDQLLDSDRVD
ncbi:MAG: hypothetical protein NWR52_02130, partial [Paracoccaceae bacterium]|nr:hypothetical protein [Paracoccaceae bacterium]